MIEPSPHKRRTGRRAGDSGTRDAVLDAALELFADRGYDGTSMRAVAARAGVDPALIRHFFGHKEGLFVATMANRTVIPKRMAAAVMGPPETLGADATDAYLRLWDDDETRPILMGLVRSAMTSDHGAELLIEIITGQIQGQAIPDMTDQRKVRGFALAVSHLFGIAMARHILRIPPIPDIPHDELVATVAPVIQGYLAPLLE